MRVSLPTTTLARRMERLDSSGFRPTGTEARAAAWGWVLSTWATARPTAMAISPVIGNSLANPRMPSVPNSFFVIGLFPLIKRDAHMIRQHPDQRDSLGQRDLHRGI